MSFLNGKKTYLIAAIAFILGGLQALGVVDGSLVTKIDFILAPLGLAFLRAGVSKNVK